MTDKAGDFIRHNWPVIAALAAALIAWGTSTAQLAGLAASNDRVLTKLDRQNEALSEIRANVSGIQAGSLAQGSRVADLEIRLRSLEARRQ